MVDRKRIELHKIKNKYNPAGLFTTYLTRDETDTIVDRLNHSFEEGRSIVAPELSHLHDWHEHMLFLALEKYNIKCLSV